MNKTNVSTALGVISEPFGKSVKADRHYLLAKLNAIRGVVHSHFPRLFEFRFAAFQIQNFPNGAVTNSGYPNYFGITLPRGFSAPVKAWQCNEPLALRSEWRSMYSELMPCRNELSVALVPGKYPTERDLLVPSKLSVYSDSEQDSGKTMIVTARYGTVEKRLRFDLSFDSVIQANFMVDQIISVSLPELAGSVTLLAGDRALSKYYHGETVPAYTRIAVHTRKACDVFIQARQLFEPVYFDTDIVEVGDFSVLEWLAKFVRWASSAEQSKRELAIECFNLARSQIDAGIRVSIGKMFRDGTPGGKVNKRNILPGYLRKK